jgi:DNA-binding NarL/FixJ family response regulator
MEQPLKSQSDKRIILLESNQLLNAGVKSVLTSHGYTQVIGVPAKNMESILREIEDFEPNVIIMDENSWEVNLSQLAPYLTNNSTIRTVVVNLQDNHISIHDKRNIQIHQTIDFIDVL